MWSDKRLRASLQADCSIFVCLEEEQTKPDQVIRPNGKSDLLASSIYLDTIQIILKTHSIDWTEHFSMKKISVAFQCQDLTLYPRRVTAVFFYRAVCLWIAFKREVEKNWKMITMLHSVEGQASSTDERYFIIIGVLKKWVHY